MLIEMLKRKTYQIGFFLCIDLQELMDWISDKLKSQDQLRQII